jgi:hypothetical protein
MIPPLFNLLFLLFKFISSHVNTDLSVHYLLHDIKYQSSKESYNSLSPNSSFKTSTKGDLASQAYYKKTGKYTIYTSQEHSGEGITNEKITSMLKYLLQ